MNETAVSMADNFQNNNEQILKIFPLFLGYVFRFCNIINVRDVKTLKDIPMRLSYNDSTIVAFRIKTGRLFAAVKFRTLNHRTQKHCYS